MAPRLAPREPPLRGDRAGTRAVAAPAGARVPAGRPRGLPPLPPGRGGHERPTPARPRVEVPRATLVALSVLVLSAGISFGYVIRRGGIDLPVVGATPSSSALAVVSSHVPGASVVPPSAPPSIGPSGAPPSIGPSGAPSPSEPHRPRSPRRRPLGPPPGRRPGQRPTHAEADADHGLHPIGIAPGTADPVPQPVWLLHLHRPLGRRAVEHRQLVRRAAGHGQAVEPAGRDGGHPRRFQAEDPHADPVDAPAMGRIPAAAQA